MFGHSYITMNNIVNESVNIDFIIFVYSRICALLFHGARAAEANITYA